MKIYPHIRFIHSIITISFFCPLIACLLLPLYGYAAIPTVYTTAVEITTTQTIPHGDNRHQPPETSSKSYEAGKKICSTDLTNQEIQERAGIADGYADIRSPTGLEYFNGIDPSSSGVPISPLYKTVAGISVDPDNYPIAQLPRECTRFIDKPGSCKRSQAIEVSLEIEFWGHVLSRDTDGVRKWVDKAILYAFHSRTPYAYRLLGMSAFGLSMVVFDNPIGSKTELLGIRTYVEAMAYAWSALKLEPNDLLSGYYEHFGGALLSSALRAGPLFVKEVEKIATAYDQYGLAGYEGKTFGNTIFTFVNDQGIVDRGLQELKNCEDDFCARRTTLAPYRKVGNMLAIMDALYASYRTNEANLVYQQARDWAISVNAPARVVEMLDKKKGILDQGDLVERWYKGDDDIGLLRLPFGTYSQSDTCAACHYGVLVLPQYYEGRESSATFLELMEKTHHSLANRLKKDYMDREVQSVLYHIKNIKPLPEKGAVADCP